MDAQKMNRIMFLMVGCSFSKTYSQFILLKIVCKIQMNKSTEKIRPNKNIQTDSPKSIQKRKNLAANKNNNSRQKITDSKVYGNTQISRKKLQPSNCNIPSPRAFFKRSGSRENSFRFGNGNKSNEVQNFTQPNASKEPQVRAEYTIKFSQLRKRLSFEIEQKEKLKQNNADKDGKLAALGQQIVKLKQQIKWYQQQVQKNITITQEKDKQLVRTHFIIQSLNKMINSNKSHTKKQFKYVESKEENILCKIQKLIQENGELAKKISQLKSQNTGKKTQTIEQDKHINKGHAYSLQLQVNRLKKQLQKDKSERQKHLQLILRQLQSKLYEKQNDLRKNSVHINLMGRRHTLSIDEVRQKKDQEIRYLRQKFLKVSKDLKQIKNKNDKKKGEKDSLLRQVKSYKDIMFNSDTDDLTFELSSEV